MEKYVWFAAAGKIESKACTNFGLCRNLCWLPTEDHNDYGTIQTKDYSYPKRLPNTAGSARTIEGWTGSVLQITQSCCLACCENVWCLSLVGPTGPTHSERLACNEDLHRYRAGLKESTVPTVPCVPCRIVSRCTVCGCHGNIPWTCGCPSLSTESKFKKCIERNGCLVFGPRWCLDTSSHLCCTHTKLHREKSCVSWLLSLLLIPCPDGLQSTGFELKLKLPTAQS